MKLGEVLIKEGAIDEGDLMLALKSQKEVNAQEKEKNKRHKFLGQIMMDLNLIDYPTLFKAVLEQRRLRRNKLYGK